MFTRLFLSVAVAALLVGCSSTPTATEADFGNSIASLKKAQTANPATISNPSSQPVTGVDPDYANSVIETMRESASKPDEVGRPIEIRVGSQGGN